MMISPLMPRKTGITSVGQGRGYVMMLQHCRESVPERYARNRTPQAEWAILAGSNLTNLARVRCWEAAEMGSGSCGGHHGEEVPDLLRSRDRLS